MKASLILKWLSRNWMVIVVSGFVAFLAAVTLRVRLFTLVAGSSPQEAITQTYLKSHSVAPWQEAVGAPYYLLLSGVDRLVGNQADAARITSIVFAFLAVALFFVLLKLWFNTSAALAGVTLLGTSSWFLHTARSGTPLILCVVMPMLLLVCCSWLVAAKRKRLPLLVGSAVLAVSCYSPHMLWLLVPGLTFLLFKNRAILAKIRRTDWIVSGAIVAILLIPLLYALTRDPGKIKALLGIPPILPSLGVYIRQLSEIPTMLVVRSAPEAALHLGRLPLLDVCSAIFLVLGAAYYGSRLGLRRTASIAGFFVIGILLIALSNSYQYDIALLMVPVYVLIASGVYYFLKQWLVIFPRNPLARSVGVLTMFLLIGFISYYHLSSYFIAWPNAPETKAAYSATIE